MKIEAMTAAGNEALSAAAFTVMDSGGLSIPFGDFPQSVILAGPALEKARKAGVRVRADGRVVVIQRVDAEAGNAMAQELGSLLGQARRMFMGAPIYEGHPYHPDPAQRQNHPNKRALGWIKQIDVLENEIRLVPSYNSLGAEAVNDAQLAYHSPEWLMDLVGAENGVGIYRPVRLRSTGLTNEPNIPVPALVASNEDGGEDEESDEDQVNAPNEDFLDNARQLLAAAEAADFAPLAVALNDAIAGDEAGLMERLAELRTRLPELALQVKAGSETVAAWEAVLGAAAGNGLAAQAEESTPTPNPEDIMLKKLLELLAAAGLIQADDPEDMVLTKLSDFKNELGWKREELERQKAIAGSLRAALPAANVAEVPEPEVLSEALVTVAVNEVTSLRAERDELTAAVNEFREALAAASLERLVSGNAITGAEVDATRERLLECANQADMQSVVQELCKPGADGAKRVTDDLAGGKEKVAASNDANARSRERSEVVAQELARLTAGKAAKPGQYEMAWNAARKSRPDLFES